MTIIRVSSSWCASCIVTYKDWIKLKENFKDNNYIEYDLDMDEEVEKYKIGNTIPVIIIEKDNKEITRIIGEKKYEEIVKIVKEVGNE